MNRAHRKLCSSPEWAAIAAGRIVPAVLEMAWASLGDDVLELGPGYGATTLALAERLERLTALELDPRLADRLRAIVPGHVTVVDGDATSIPFPDECFSGVVAFTMLHHISPRPRQDSLFAETRRVLRPGGVFAGTDSPASLRLRVFHRFDTFEPLDPVTLPNRLQAAGFDEVEVYVGKPGVRFLAVKPTIRR